MLPFYNSLRIPKRIPRGRIIVFRKEIMKLVCVWASVALSTCVGEDVMSVGTLEIRLFGSIQISSGGEPMPRARNRAVEWLLALLVLQGGKPVSRSWLAGTLWPESSEEQA